MKKLFLVRHAKASLEDPDVLDVQRKITEEGKHQVIEFIKYLKQENIKPDLIVCSNAVRARQTAQLIAKGLDLSENGVYIEPRLYEENVTFLMETIKEVSDLVGGLMIVGHNPTLSWFASYLSNNPAVNLETCGMFAIEFDIQSWPQIVEAQGKEIFNHA